MENRTIKEEIEYVAGTIADGAIAHGAPYHEYHKGYIEGGEKGHEITMERAVEWLKHHADDYTYGSDNARFDMREFIDDFKKAMAGPKEEWPWESDSDW